MKKTARQLARDEIHARIYGAIDIMSKGEALRFVQSLHDDLREMIDVLKQEILQSEQRPR